MNVSTAKSSSVHTVLTRALNKFFSIGHSIAVWRKPNSDEIHFAASSETKLIAEVNLEQSKPGFLFAPFHPDQPKLFLPADEWIVFRQNEWPQAMGQVATEIVTVSTREELPAANRHARPAPAQASTSQHHYKDLVTQCRELVTEGRFEKLVPSRFMRVSIDPQLDLATVFDTLCARYPHAMVSLFSSPATGTWMGATPELLVSVEGHQFQTVAVAGTQPYQDGMDIKSVTWTQKEIEEQALVERYIISCFKKIRVREYDEYGPRTAVAGNLLHLKTEFKVDMQETNFPQLGSVMLKLLHPTSAVCGSPLKESLTFLQEHEGYDRQYYSGYLGPVNINKASALYVNLRCMQLFQDEAVLFAGAGVVADSEPEKEWLETEMKMNTLLQIIRP
ncbi:MAG: chorismate-binding protein [Bacteroidetes bacterium]|nr:chorismate-binding protein [Bacteroidota bacterium]